MKNKNLFFRIYLIFVIILFISIITLALLGKKERIGYLSEFKIDVDKTLELNNFNNLKIEEIKDLFTIDNILDYNNITNYIFTNDAITNYSYDFRIKYYDKVFRNSDIYGVYPNVEKIAETNDYIKKIEMNGNGSPFGNFISTEIIDTDKIDNINYTLNLKKNFVIFPIILLIILPLFFNGIYLIKDILLFFNLQKKTFKIYSLTIITYVFIILFLSILGKKEQIGYLSEFDFISNRDGINIYKFKIDSNKKILKNNFIYDIYPNLNNLPAYVKYSKLDITDKSSGILASTKKLEYNDKINNVSYYLLLNLDMYFYFLIIFVVFILSISFYFIKKYLIFKHNLIYSDYIFINKIEFVAILLFIFHYWLFYPGDISGWDTWASIIESLFKGYSNWHPIMLSLNIHAINKIGLTMSIFFFMHLGFWYLSLYIIILSLYLKYKKKVIMLLFLVSFIAQIFLNNIIYYKDFIATSYVILSYSIIFFIIINNIKDNDRNILKFVSLTILIIGMLHRHNFIVTVYPILIWFTYDYLKNNNITTIKKQIFYFINIMCINALILISIYFIFPRVFIKNIVKTASNHIYFLQIAGCLVPANDSSLIPDDWWGENKKFEDLVIQYNNDPYYADPIRNNHIFLDKENIKKVWINSILKYPKNYIKHTLNFTKTMWTLKYTIPDSYDNKYINSHAVSTYSTWFGINSDEIYKTTFVRDNQGIKFTKLKSNVYNILKKLLLNINVSFYITLSIILFFISGIFLLLKKEFRNSILIFTFSVSFSAVATAIIVVLFSPVANVSNFRYIYPVIPISIISLIGFITFIYDRGGFKKFVKELRGNNK